LDGEGFAFVPGPDPDTGKAVVSVLRLGGDFIYRSSRNAFTMRATYSAGLPVLGATINSGGEPDGVFNSGLLQLQWAYRLPWLDTEMVLGAEGQLSDAPLLALEQFAIGGRFTVRGYREKQLVRDEGVAGSIEFRVPIWSRTNQQMRFELAPFFDVGYSSNQGRPTPEPRTLMSVGIGGRLQLTRYVAFELYWGQELRQLPVVGEWNLQDAGISLGATIRYP